MFKVVRYSSVEDIVPPDFPDKALSTDVWAKWRSKKWHVAGFQELPDGVKIRDQFPTNAPEFFRYTILWEWR